MKRTLPRFVSCLFSIFLVLAACFGSAFANSELDRIGLQVRYGQDKKLYMAGHFKDFVDFGNGNVAQLAGTGHTGIFICQMDTNGTVGWHTLIDMGYLTGVGQDHLPANLILKYTADGHLLLSGSMKDSMQIPAGTPAILGTPTGFIAQFDTAGNFNWVYIPPSPSSCNFTGLTRAGSNTLLTGNSYYPVNFGSGFSLTGYSSKYILKLDATGTPIQLINTANAAPKVFEPAGNGSFIIGGDAYIQTNSLSFGGLTATNTVQFSNNANTGWLSEIDSNGVATWLHLFDGTFDFMWSMALHADGRIAVGGDYSGTLSIGGTPALQMAFPYRTSYLGSIRPSGNGQWAISATQAPPPSFRYNSVRGLASGPESSTWLSGFYTEDLQWNAANPIYSYLVAGYLNVVDSAGAHLCLISTGAQHIMHLERGDGPSMYAASLNDFSSADTLRLLKSNGNCSMVPIASFPCGAVPPLVAVDAPVEIGFKLWPNPGSGRIHVAAEFPGQGPASVTVLDLQGRVLAVLMQDANPAAGHFEKEFDVSSLPGGCYLLQVQQGNSRQLKKMLLR